MFNEQMWILPVILITLIFWRRILILKKLEDKEDLDP